MGFWSKLFSGAEGCRKAMRKSYERHLLLAQQGRFPTDDPPHVIGLYGALGSRYHVRGGTVNEMVMWGELAPFLMMSETEAVEALAEYAVYLELPQDARISWLKARINSVLLSSSDEPRMVMAGAGLRNHVAWCALLEPTARRVIETVVGKPRDV